MSFLKVGADMHEQISFFIQNVRNVEGIEKTVNLTAEKLMQISKDLGFEPRLAEFFRTNLHQEMEAQGRFI